MTTQLFFPADITAALQTVDPYSRVAAAAWSTTNSNDGIFAASNLMDMTGSNTAGWVGNYTLIYPLTGSDTGGTGGPGGGPGGRPGGGGPSTVAFPPPPPPSSPPPSPPPLPPKYSSAAAQQSSFRAAGALAAASAAAALIVVVLGSKLDL